MRHCQRWEMLPKQGAWRDLDGALPVLPLLFSSPSPLLATAGVPPRAAGEGTLASQEEVGMMTEEGNMRRDCASGLQEDGMVVEASG